MSGSSALPAQVGNSIFVVDSWPVLELLYGREPARSRFIARLEAAERGQITLLLGRINSGEITYNLLIKQRLGQFLDIRFTISDFPFKVVPVDDQLVDEAAQLKGAYPISFADAFVAALARRHNAPVVTGDPDFQRLQGIGVVELDWIGK